MIRHWCLALAAFLAVGGVQVAQGEMVLKLSATGSFVPTNPIIVADGQDVNYEYAPGFLTTWADPDGTINGEIAPFNDDTPVGDFMVSANTIATSMLLDGVFPSIDTFLIVTSGAAGTFTAELTDTGFTLPLNFPDWLLTGYVGSGRSGSPLTIQAAFDSANQEFGVSSSVTSGVLGPGDFNASLTFDVTPSNPFSLSQKMTITASGPLQETGFNYQLIATPNPEPTSLVLWGVVSGVGLCVVRYQRARGKNGSQPAIASS